MGNDTSPVMRVMPEYQSFKRVRALKIKEVHPDGTLVFIEPGYIPLRVGEAFMAKHDPQPGGYFVVYQDGYQSFSPAQAFESGYVRVGFL